MPRKPNKNEVKFVGDIYENLIDTMNATKKLNSPSSIGISVNGHFNCMQQGVLYFAASVIHELSKKIDGDKKEIDVFISNSKKMFNDTLDMFNESKET